MALKTALPLPPHVTESWTWAIANGQWIKMRGFDVLQLGAADYIAAKPSHDTAPYRAVLYSVNGDNGTPELPFGLRWSVTKDNIAHDSYGTPLDRLAVEQFKLRGLI